MTNANDRMIFDRLGKVLEAERKALLSGRLEELAALMEDKESLIDALGRLQSHPGDNLRYLHEKITRNQALLDGALQGIRNVAARLALFRTLRTGMETYDHRGRKRLIQGDAPHDVEKRA